MGLKMTLTKGKNRLYTDFIDAYWAIDDVFFTYDTVDFSLYAYPSREAKLLNGTTLADPSIGWGGPTVADTVFSSLYQWHAVYPLTDIFPSGAIPAGRDAQYTAIYNWIKEYTKLPFEDVLEQE